MTPMGVIKMLAAATYYDSRVKRLDETGVMFWAEQLREIPDEDVLVLVKRIYQTHQVSPLQTGTVLEEWRRLSAERARELRKQPFRPVLRSYATIEEEREDVAMQREKWLRERLRAIRGNEQTRQQELSKGH